MDICSIHHVEPVEELLQDASILLIFLPPTALITILLRKLSKNRDKILQILQAPEAAFDNVTAQDCNSWITYA